MTYNVSSGTLSLYSTTTYKSTTLVLVLLIYGIVYLSL